MRAKVESEGAGSILTREQAKSCAAHEERCPRRRQRRAAWTSERRSTCARDVGLGLVGHSLSALVPKPRQRGFRPAATGAGARLAAAAPERAEGMSRGSHDPRARYLQRLDVQIGLGACALSLKAVDQARLRHWRKPRRDVRFSPQDQPSSGIPCWGSCNINTFIQQLPRPRIQPAGMTLPPTMTCSSEAQSDLKVSTSMPTKPSGACPREPQHPRVRCAARIGTGQAVPGASGGALDASRGLRPKPR